jgi:glycogen operon protein
VEGPTDDPAIERLRNRQIKSLMTVTLLSLGVPMILMGDEMRRTQGGNNNAYCQDNETSWLDWTLLKKHADVYRFVKLLTARRLLRGTEHERERMTLSRLIAEANKAWHGARLNQPDWSDHSRSIALTVELRQEKLLLHLILNAFWEPLDFELPRFADGSARAWRRWIDTAQPSPDDIVPWEKAPKVPGLNYRAEARSVVALHAPAN